MSAACRMPPRRKDRQIWITGLACLVLLTTTCWGLLSASFAGIPPPGSIARSRVLVVPFDNLTRDSRIFWMGEAAAVLLADDLGALEIEAITREQRRRAFDRLQVPPASALTEATVIRIGQLVGATEVVIGSLERAGETLIVRARSIALETGRVRASSVARGPLTDLFRIFERVARQIAPSSARSTAASGSQPPPLPVFENYIKGLLASTPATAIGYLQAAVRGQPSFDRARLALWDLYEDQGDHARALDAVRAVPDTSPWIRRARFLAGLSELGSKKYDEAFATFSALAPEGAREMAGSKVRAGGGEAVRSREDARAASPAGSRAGDGSPKAAELAAVMNNLGVVQIRRSAGSAETGQPAYYFNRAVELDPDDSDYFFNLGYAYWAARDTQAAIYWLREAVRRNPTDGDAHFVLAAALSAAGTISEASREKELAGRLSSTYERREMRPSGPGGEAIARPAGDAVPKGLERIKSDVELPHPRTAEASWASFEQRDQRELARFYLAHARRLYQLEQDREAAADLQRALYLSPYEAEAHLLMGRIDLRNGRPREAIDALRISLWSEETAEAHVVLGEAFAQLKDPKAARQEAERALQLDPASKEARRLIARLESR